MTSRNSALSAARGVVACLYVAAVALPSAAQAAQLLSIRGLDFAANEYVDAFEIRTRNVNVIAVCRIPTGWEVSAQNDQGGPLRGGAGRGVAGLDRSRTNELSGLFLLADPNPSAGPVKLDGVIWVRTYGTADVRELPLQSSNYVLETVERCP